MWPAILLRPDMNPLCPNCSKPMGLLKAAERPNDEHAFECKTCGVVYMTTDHIPIAGPSDHSTNE
jgi:uncharacterized protein YbaR (Trm112 family)